MPTAAAVGFLLEANAIDMLRRIRTEVVKNVTTMPSNQRAPVSRRVRLVVIGLESVAAIVLAYFIVQLFYAVVTPINVPSPSIFANAEGREGASTPTNFEIVTSFDPFFRQTSAEPASAAAAPESSLRITVAGTRAARLNGDQGAGTAIVNDQDGGQKLVKIGDEIAPGVQLAAVFSDRIEITRSGARETIYMRKPNGAVSADAVQRPPQAESASAQITSVSGRGQSNGVWVQQLLSNIPFEPVREEGRLVGFSIGETEQDAFLGGLGLEEGDVVLAVAGSPLTSFERLTELTEELDTTRPVVLDIERRGERLSITVGE